MITSEKFISEAVYPQPSPYREAVTERYDLPEVFLSEYREWGYKETTFRIIAEEGPVGFLWMEQYQTKKHREAQVTFSLLAPKPELFTDGWEITHSKYRGKGYGLAAYVVAMESLAEQGAVLRNGKTMTEYAVKLWQKLTDAGVAVCLTNPRELSGDYKNSAGVRRPPFFRAGFRAKTLAEMAV